MSKMPDKKPPTADTEREYLRQQAEFARSALREALARLGVDAKALANPARWAKRYPWATVGSAAAAGFVAAYLLVPSQEDRELAKLARIERALHPCPQPESTNGDGASASHSPATGVVGAVVRDLLRIVQPALTGLLSAVLTAKATRDDPEDPTDDAG